MRRRVQGWETPFGRFVSEYGVPALARDLTAQGEPVIPSSIYKWMAGVCNPRPQLARKLVTLSEGQLSLEAIFEHRDQVLGTGVGDGIGMRLSLPPGRAPAR
jgi:hypothetical protein